MPQGLNKVILIGIIGNEAEMRYAPSGKSATTFSIIVDREWKDQENISHSHTESFSVLCWDEMAEKAKNDLRVEMRVYVEGFIQTRQWIDDQGNKKKAIEVIAEHLIRLDKQEEIN